LRRFEVLECQIVVFAFSGYFIFQSVFSLLDLVIFRVRYDFHLQIHALNDRIRLDLFDGQSVFFKRSHDILECLLIQNVTMGIEVFLSRIGSFIFGKGHKKGVSVEN